MTRRRKSTLTVAAACTLGVGLAVSGVLFAAVGALEYGKMRLDFEQRAGVRAAAIERGLDDAVQVLAVTGQLFAAAAPVSRRQFHDFTAPLLQKYPFIQAFNFHRIITLAERPAYEAEMRRTFPGFSITEHEGGRLRRAGERASYDVVHYLEPMAGNERAFGLDSGYLPAVTRAIDEVLSTGQPRSTGLVRLAQSKDAEPGLVMMAPVYHPGASLSSAAERKEAWLGDAAIVVRAPSLIDKILATAGLPQDGGVALRVYVGNPAQPGNLVYSHDGQARETAQQAGLAQEAAPAPGAMLARWFAFHQHAGYQRSYTVLGQPWEVRVSALPQGFLDSHLGSLCTLLGGVLFSVLMAALVQSLVLRSRRVQMLVDARTAELRTSNERLAADVAMRKQTERALLDSEQRFRRLLALSSDWYWEQDAFYRFTSITDGFFEKGRLSRGRFLGRTRWESSPEMLATRWGRDHIALLEARLPFSDLEYAITGDDGVQRWFHTSGEPVYDARGEFKGYRGTGNDITQRKLSEQRFQHIAHHDTLTGLPNRALLQERLARGVAYAQRSGRPVWVLLIDLDRFKFVNDSLGHKAGDVLLQTVAARLLSAVRPDDTVARLSGDEFVAILADAPDAALSPDIVQRVMDAVARPVPLEGKEFSVTCSIGVASYDGSGSAQHLIEHADIAMYAAKKLGRNGFQFYEQAMNDEAQERLSIENALRNALERGEFALHYQPQVDIESGRITGAEALLRWQHPELGLVPPARFIGLAEETGLIVPIGAWVLRTACAQAKAWLEHSHGQAALRMAVNLSARQFSQPGLVAMIAGVLADTGLPPACLELELTESVFMNDVAQAVDLLHRLKALGVTLSIDDFGTGYSSLSYLRDFPIDVLKIDRSFVNDIATDPDDAAIVVSVIALAHNLKLRVVAEGVEDRAQLDFLQAHGCDAIQGYYFSRPTVPDLFEQMVRQGRHLDSAHATLAA